METQVSKEELSLGLVENQDQAEAGTARTSAPEREEDGKFPMHNQGEGALVSLQKKLD
jgi:hypothetical protein